MGDAAYNCVKCGSQMVKGFAGDKGEKMSIFPTTWWDGEPVHATLLGITGDNLKVDRPQKRTVRGMRCTHCGYLELYAV